MIQSGLIEKTIGGALIGGIFGGSYAIVRTFLSQPSFADRLTPKPECFDMDAKVGKAFFDIAKYRYVDEGIYVEALHNMDSLLCIEKQIHLGEISPCITDPPMALQTAVRVLTHLRSLRDKLEDNEPYEEMNGYIREVEKICETHVHNIELLAK
jgi:hypothetical protein